MTKIEWVRGDDGSEGMSWNALRAVRIDENGRRRSANHCEHVNEACRFCYADRTNVRLGGLPFKPGHRKDYTFEIDERKLLEPLRRKKPTRIFVESMSDALGDWWPDHFIDKLYAVMALCPQHTFINLSKRPERRREYLKSRSRSVNYWDNAARSFGHALRWEVPSDLPVPFAGKTMGLCPFPLPNVIEGTSVSCQEEADAFVPILLDTLAALRVVSAEPLLGPINFTELHTPRFPLGLNGLRGSTMGKGLDWIIVGGESGPKARPMHPQWARDIRDQCQAAGVAFFFKQWGEWAPTAQTRIYEPEKPIHVFRTGEVQTFGGPLPIGIGLRRVGKKSAGRLLDGVEHNGFPDHERLIKQRLAG
jgi:protein gp37